MAVPRRPLPERRWRRLTRWLGGPDSWRRIIATGVTAGVTLAVVAALITALILGDGGSLDGDEPSDVPIADGGVEPEPVETFEEPPVDVPTEPPFEEPPTQVPTEVIEEPPPTEEPVEPEPTVPEEIPPEPTLAEGA